MDADTEARARDARDRRRRAEEVVRWLHCGTPDRPDFLAGATGPPRWAPLARRCRSGRL